jgi:hypothetical protein
VDDQGKLYLTTPLGDHPSAEKPVGAWEYKRSSGWWEFAVGGVGIWAFSEAALLSDQDRVVSEEPFIEVIEGNFMGTLVIRRIEKDPPEHIIAFLRERGVRVRSED